jgi:hypothetical protein
MYLGLSNPLATNSWKHLHYWLLASRFAGRSCFMALILYEYILKVLFPWKLRILTYKFIWNRKLFISFQDWTSFTEFFCYSLYVSFKWHYRCKMFFTQLLVSFLLRYLLCEVLQMNIPVQWNTFIMCSDRSVWVTQHKIVALIF